MAAAIDSHGNIVAAGDTTNGPIDLGSGPVGQAGITCFVTKRAADDGSELWSIAFNGDVPTAFGDSFGVAIAANDDVIVVGAYQGVVNFGGQTLGVDPPEYNAGTFLARYDQDGNLAWVHDLGLIVGAASLAVGANDTIFVGGFAPNGAVPPAPTGTGFLMAFDGSGTALWRHDLGPFVASVAARADGDVAIAGTMNSAYSFGGPVVSATNDVRSAFVATYHHDGTYAMAQSVGPATAATDGTGVVLLQSGLALVQEVEEFVPLPGEGGIYAVDDAGMVQWSATIPDDGSSSPQLRAFATTWEGMTTSIAWVDSPYNADHPGTVTGHMEVAVFDTAGGRTTSTFGQRLTGAANATMARAAAASPNGKLAIVGDFSGMLDFGFGPVSAGAAMFIVVVDAPCPQSQVGDGPCIRDGLGHQ
jgi:hypothetical protein